MKTPGPDHPITISANARRVRVRFAGRTIADTARALTLKEAHYPPVHYIPRADADMSATAAWLPQGKKQEAAETSSLEVGTSIVSGVLPGRRMSPWVTDRKPWQVAVAVGVGLVVTVLGVYLVFRPRGGPDEEPGDRDSAGRPSPKDRPWWCSWITCLRPCIARSPTRPRWCR